MLNIYTVSFFGHRQIDNISKIENKLEDYIYQLLTEKEYVEFLVGREGEFDIIVSSCVSRVRKNIIDKNCTLTWVMPYFKSEYQKNRANFESYFDNIEVCDLSAKAHYKSAIQIRNRNMVDRSDLIIFYVNKSSGGAYHTQKYAEKKRKEKH